MRPVQTTHGPTDGRPGLPAVTRALALRQTAVIVSVDSLIMSRPTVIQNDTIIAAAREVFLERGLLGTTADVAARAGVSEETIFKRFKSKDDLFRAAMQPPMDPALFAGLAQRVGKGDVREQLEDVGMLALEQFTRLVPFIMTMVSSPGFPGLATAREGSHPATRGVRAVMGYLEAEMRLGRLRRSDPEILARTFMGALFNYAFLDTTTTANLELPLPAPTFVRGLVAVLWAGIEPQPNASASIGTSERTRTTGRPTSRKR